MKLVICCRGTPMERRAVRSSISSKQGFVSVPRDDLILLYNGWRVNVGALGKQFNVSSFQPQQNNISERGAYIDTTGTS